MTDIRLVVSDVDGTLVTKDKRLMPASVTAVEALHERGIMFTITSSRPSFGMRMLIAPLKLKLPIGPFNGSALVNPDLSVVEQHLIPKAAAIKSLALFERHKVDAWIFTDSDWIIRRDDSHYVAHEQKTIQTDPRFTTDDAPYLDKACKIVGVSEDFALLERCETELQAELGAQANAVRSQNYYLDVTPPNVNKGTFVAAMGQRLGIPLQQIATIGDMQNDVPMFKTSGLSFAMANASDAVKAQATHVTATNEDNGFAKAMEQLLQSS